jgi:hypothetical protein
MSATSLFIPFVFPNFDQKYVANAFANIGNVDRVDFVAKQDRAGKTYNAAYVHFKDWYNNKEAKHLYEQCFQKNEKYEFYHDDNEYFWIVLPNTAKKHIPGERKPRIGLGVSNTINLKSLEKRPEKASYSQIVTDKQIPTKLELDFDFEEEFEQRETELEEIEAEMEKDIEKMKTEDKNLVSIDWRYVQAIEQENISLRREIQQLKIGLMNCRYNIQYLAGNGFLESSIDL